MKTFEEKMRLLEELVEKLESGNLGLEESLAAYESAMTLSKELDAQLSEGEKKIRILYASGQEGELSEE